MNNKNKLAIADLDGTLFDTEDVNFHSYKEAISLWGVQIEKEKFLELSRGKDYTEFLPEITGYETDIEAIHDAKKKFYSENLWRSRINNHLLNLLKGIKGDYYLALVTTASRKNATDILSFYDLTSFFDLILAKEDIPKLKPDPVGFLMAIEHFGLDPSDVLIFEDSEEGINAAMKTGATVFRTEHF